MPRDDSECIQHKYHVKLIKAGLIERGNPLTMNLNAITT